MSSAPFTAVTAPAPATAASTAVPSTAASTSRSNSAAPDAAAPADAARLAEDLRAELEGLVRIAARRPRLVVREGDPGCGWSFAWDSDTVTVDPGDLRSLAPDLCRGLALHEAAHAAVTVLHRLLAPARLDRIHPLLNTIEDIRIEIWMRSRFPGAIPWIRAYNDVFFAIDPTRPLPQSRQVQFLGGILEGWWHGITRPGLWPEVRDALESCREAVAAATACQPPLDDAAEGILASQRAMWTIVQERIVPTWQRLVTLDRRAGIGPLAVLEVQEFLERLGAGGTGRPRGSAALRPSTSDRRRGEVCRGVPRDAARRTGRHTTGQVRAEDRARAQAAGMPCTPPDAYLAAWRRIGGTADRLADELLRVVVPRRRLRWASGYPTGSRLDLRVAMQSQVDPQLSARLWSRSILPPRRDPAVLLLVDRSSSMTQDGRIQRAFEGMVLLTEVCRRIGVPAAVWSFADDVREELAWDGPVNDAARQRLGQLVVACNGSTDMAAALDGAGAALAHRHGDPKFLFVIGDGEPDRHEPTLAAVQRLDAAGITPIGLGLGEGTAGLARYVPRSVTGIRPERLVDHVAGLLGEALLADAAR